MSEEQILNTQNDLTVDPGNGDGTAANGNATANEGTTANGGASGGEKPSAGGTGSGRQVNQQGSVNTSTGNINAGGDFHSGIHNETHNRQEFNYLFGSQDTFWKPFTPDFLTSISEDAEMRLVGTYVADGEQFEALYGALTEKRLVVLTGEPEAGKTTTVLQLSHRLRQVSDDFNGAHLIRVLDRNVKIDFRDIVKRTADYGHRLLLFQDAFARGNRDVLDFFTQMGQHALGSITDQLHGCGLFLVFTADAETVKLCQRQLAALDIECRLLPLSRELLLEGLEAKLSRLAEARQLNEAEIESRLPAAERYEAVGLLRTMPRVTLFVEHDFLKLGPELNWREAIHRIDSLEDWFLSSNLADDFDAWCFVLTLALCQCAPYAPGVPWLEFEYFREVFSARLRRKLRANWDELTRPPFKELVSENLLLERCRAEVYKDPATGADFVRFADDRYSDMLWEVLLRSSRRVLSLLIEPLKAVAEQFNPVLRARAASILGRLGELDPPHVTYACMAEWIDSDTAWQRATVGYLYQGIWASRNNSYREGCLRRLAELVLDGGPSEDAAEARPKVWTAIAAYRQLGAYDLPLAMDNFKKITERYFSGVIEDTTRVERLLRRIERTLDDRKNDLNDLDSKVLSLYHDILSEIARRVFQGEGKVLVAVQYAIVALCLTGDPVKIFDELLKWTAADRKSLGALVALMFLEQNGIAAELESRVVATPAVAADGKAEFYDCNLLVLAVAASDDTVRRTASFLAAVYDSFFSFYPPHSCSYFTKSFAIHLKMLVENSMPVERLRAAIVHLFDELMVSENEELRKLVFNIVHEDPDFAFKESKYAAFRKELQRRRLNLDAMTVSLT